MLIICWEWESLGKNQEKNEKFFQPSDAGVLLHIESKHKILFKNSAFTGFFGKLYVLLEL